MDIRVGFVYSGERHYSHVLCWCLPRYQSDGWRWALYHYPAYKGDIEE